MKNNIYYILAINLLFFACSDDGHSGPEPLPPVGHATLTITLPTIKDPATYALNEADENTIKEIDVLVFKRTDHNDYYSYRLQLSENEITDISGSDQGDRKTFDVEIRKDSLVFVVIANARASVDQISGLLEQGNVDKEVIFENLVFTQSGKWPVTSGSFTPLPMWGETTNLVRRTDVSIGPVSLLRAVARIDIGIDIFGDPALGFGQKFKLKDIYIYNVMDKGFIAPAIDDAGLEEDEPTATFPHIPQNAGQLENPLKYEYNNNGEAIQKLFREIYITESAVNNVFLVISGYYDNDSETFYKIAFTDNNNHIPILRNHRYLINITGVRRKGYATLEQAYASEAANIINDIFINELYGLTEYEFNGQYMLGVGDGNITINWQAQEVKILVNTTYPQGWKATIDQAASSWLSMVHGEGTGNRFHNDTIRINAGRNTDEFVREAKIVIQAGDLRKEIFIKQRLGANCYIVKPNETVHIPIAFANADGTIRVTDGMSFDASILWTENLNIINGYGTYGAGKNAMLLVQTGNREGNAVIIVTESGTGKTIWSWHIWVTDFDPEYVANQKKNNNIIFMDRNLGALTDNPTSVENYGLLYQWGRKDPFPGAVSFDTADESYDSKPIYQGNGQPINIDYQEVTNDLTLNKALGIPLTFLTSSSYPHNWHINGANNLWSHNGEKTPYDPSPDGWKVPESGNGSHSPWYGFNIDNGTWDENTKGRLFLNYTYYPATGARSYVDGSFHDVSKRGYVWSATAAGFQAFCFNFGSTSVTPSMTTYKANAFPIRCVKDDN